MQPAPSNWSVLCSAVQRCATACPGGRLALRRLRRQVVPPVGASNESNDVLESFLTHTCENLPVPASAAVVTAVGSRSSSSSPVEAATSGGSGQELSLLELAVGLAVCSGLLAGLSGLLQLCLAKRLKVGTAAADTCGGDGDVCGSNGSKKSIYGVGGCAV